jgi:hypothetical protein
MGISIIQQLIDIQYYRNYRDWYKSWKPKCHQLSLLLHITCLWWTGCPRFRNAMFIPCCTFTHWDLFSLTSLYVVITQNIAVLGCVKTCSLRREVYVCPIQKTAMNDDLDSQRQCEKTGGRSDTIVRPVVGYTHVHCRWQVFWLNRGAKWSRFGWPCGRRCRSAGPRLLASRVQIPPRTQMFVSCVCGVV